MNKTLLVRPLFLVSHYPYMKTREAIGKRIKELRKSRKFSQSFIAQKLFISQAAYSLIENSQNGIVAEHIIKLSKLYGIPADYILTGNKHLVEISNSSGFIPLVRAEAQAGFLKNYPDKENHQEYDWYRIPGFEPIEGQKLFEVDGKSMLPTIIPGDIVICEPQKEIDNTLEGSVVLAVLTDRILIKRFRVNPDPDVILLESDNPEDGELQEQNISRKELRELMLVKGKISSVLLAPDNKDFKGRIKSLEEVVDHLKQELAVMNQQIHSLLKGGDA